MEQEIWRDVVGLEKFYRVSNTGLVASKDRDGKDGRRRLKGRVLAITLHSKSGQTQVCMCVDGVRTQKEVSNIVAAAFIGECPEGTHACHIDSNKQNNRLDNLAYMPIKKKVEKALSHYCETSKVTKNQVTQSMLREYFEYKDGDLIRKKRTGFCTEIGEFASCKGNGQRKQISFGGCTLELNRAVYLYHYGILPHSVMPKDGDLSNCNIENLMSVSASDIAKSAWLTKREKGIDKQKVCKNGHIKSPENTDSHGRCKMCRETYLKENNEMVKAKSKRWYEKRMKFSKSGNWQAAWGSTPLPTGVVALGTITNKELGTGALLRLRYGKYAHGTDGVTTLLDKKHVTRLIDKSAVAAQRGSVSGGVKASTSRENGKKGGRPRQQQSS